MSGTAVAIAVLAWFAGASIGAIAMLTYQLSRLSDLEWRLGLKGDKP